MTSLMERVGLSDEAIEAAAKQLRAVLDEGYDDECALSSALEMLGVETRLQSQSDRIDVLEGLLREARPHVHTIDGFIVAKIDAALHQEGIDG